LKETFAAQIPGQVEKIKKLKKYALLLTSAFINHLK